MEFYEMKKFIDEGCIKYESQKSLLQEREKRLKELEDDMITIGKSQVLLQEVAKDVQSQLSIKIDNIVNLGLATLFPEYNFHLEYVTSRGKTEVKFLITDNDGDEIDVMNQNGGGVIDVLTFCLRVAVYAISNVSPIIIFDEPFRFISKSLRSKVSELLNVLSEKLSLQFIIVTHMDEISDNANVVYKVIKKDGVSNVEEN